MSLAPLTFAAGNAVRPLVVRRSAQARGLRLVVDPRNGEVRLTVPRRAALRPALAWAAEKRGWVEAQLAALPQARPLHPGSAVPFRGATLTISWARTLPRTPCLDDNRLLVGGPEELMPGRVLRWLSAQALMLLEAETREIATTAGVIVGRVAVGDPRGRWGSCTADGDIRYSWRLILAPPEVARATVAHEVAHRLHMDHSPAFHTAVARLFGRKPTAERAWLKAHGPALHWIGRS